MPTPIPVVLVCESNSQGVKKIGTGRCEKYVGTIPAWPRRGAKLNLTRNDNYLTGHMLFSTSTITNVEKVDDHTRRITTKHGSIYVVTVTDASFFTKSKSKKKMKEGGETKPAEVIHFDKPNPMDLANKAVASAFDAVAEVKKTEEN